MIEDAITKLHELLAEHPLRCGAHSADHVREGEWCALEACSVALDLPPTDSPLALDLPDIRPLNDAFVDDALRTQCMVPVIEVILPWRKWSAERRAQVAARLAELTIRRVLPPALRAVGLSSEADRCEREGTEAAARAANAADAADAAARAAYAAAAAAYAAHADAADAAHADARAAYAAADAIVYAAYADAAARDHVLRVACQCWVDAFRETDK